MERMSSSAQAWVADHKLTTIGAVCAAAVGASAMRSPRIGARRAVTVAVLGGAALVAYSSSSRSKRKDSSGSLDYDFYSQLPAATSDDGEENERWSW